MNDTNIQKNCIDTVYEGVNISEKVDSCSIEIWQPQPKIRSQISLAYKSIAFGNGNVFQLCQCVNIICITFQRKEMGTKCWSKPLPDYGAAGPCPQASDPFCEHDNCKQVWSPNLLLLYGWGGHNDENNVAFHNYLTLRWCLCSSTKWCATQCQSQNMRPTTVSSSPKAMRHQSCMQHGRRYLWWPW